MNTVRSILAWIRLSKVLKSPRGRFSVPTPPANSQLRTTPVSPSRTARLPDHRSRSVGRLRRRPGLGREQLPPADVQISVKRCDSQMTWDGAEMCFTEMFGRMARCFRHEKDHFKRQGWTDTWAYKGLFVIGKDMKRSKSSESKDRPRVVCPSVRFLCFLDKSVVHSSFKQHSNRSVLCAFKISWYLGIGIFFGW